MSKPLLPMCSLPVAVTRDGATGAYAKLLLPFHGYWFASGATYTFPTATLLQDKSASINGVNMADTYAKDCCSPCTGH